MRLDEEFTHDRDNSFPTDDEENLAELACSSENNDENSDSSNILSRNPSSNSVDGPSSAWPRSYRDSMDMMSGVTPPRLSFLNEAHIIGSSMRSLLRRNQSSSIHKPLLAETNSASGEVLASHPARASVSSQIYLDEVAEPRKCSVSQSVLNGINVLCGIGLLTTPYAVREGGWLSLLLLVMYGVIACYTGVLMKRCLESSPGLRTYPDIAQAALGRPGRLILSILLYIELYAACVEFIIMMSDNLSRTFPDSFMDIHGVSLNSRQIFAIISTLIVLPTVWVRDLSLLSYISGGGVISSVLVALCLVWLGVIDGVGFHASGQPLDLANLSVAVGIYGFGYAGHAVFPNIYSSMKEPSKFPLVLITSFAFCCLSYTGVAVCGYMMFGDAIESQFTLNMPQQFAASKIAVWTAVVTPMTKYAMTMTPIVLSFEELLPPGRLRSFGFVVFFRMALTVSTLFVALKVPFFAIVMALCGSFLAMFGALIFPCICYLSILRGRLSSLEIGVCIFIIAVGVVSACCGTYSSITRIISQQA